MEDNGGRGFGRGRSAGRSRGRGRGRSSSTMAASPSTGQPRLPSPSQSPHLHQSPLDSSTESPHMSSTPSLFSHSVDSTSSHDPLVVPSMDVGTLDADGIMLLRPGPQNTFDPPSATREVMAIIKSKFEGPWTTYREVLLENKRLTNMWFDEFKRKYKWLPEHELQMRSIFDSKASSGIRNALYKVRKNSDDGSWIPPQYREELEKKWNQEEWKGKAKLNSENRRSSDLPLHTGGSVPTTEHFKRMKNSSDKTPTLWDLFLRTHKTKKDPGKLVSTQAEQIAIEYERCIAERDSQGNQEDAEKKSDNDIYLEVVGGVNNKGRIYGLGPEAGKYKRAQATSSVGVSLSEYETMKTLVSSLTSANKELQEKMVGYDEKFESMDRSIKRLTQGSPPPTNDPPLQSPPLDQQNQDDELDD